MAKPKVPPQISTQSKNPFTQLKMSSPVFIEMNSKQGSYKITDTLYLGTHLQASNDNELKKLKITHILSIDKLIKKPKIKVKILEIDVDKLGKSNLNNILKKCKSFYNDDIVNQSNNKIFICDKICVSSSPLIAILLLMVYNKVSLNEAYTQVSKVNKKSVLHDGYVNQLIKIENDYHGQNTMKQSDFNTTKNKIDNILSMMKKAHDDLYQNNQKIPGTQ
mmetsp:Transcript_79385/g.97104  ORF Transcript_79385/g.97104 Transcript_79385/m.97104 type:complete len:220 (+) Transcript_79385:31-690(+)